SDNERDDSEASSIKETNAESLPDQEPEFEIDDIPAPMILGVPGKTLDNLVATSTSEFNLADDPSDRPGATEEVPAVLAGELPWFEEPVQSQPSDEPVYAQLEMKQSTSGDDDVKQFGQHSVIPVDETKLDPVETATVATNAEPPNTEDSRTDFAESAAPERSEAPETDREANKDLFEERLPANFEGIAKPSEELESADAYPSNSTFDSVRIMEVRPPSQPDDVATRIQSIPSRAVAQTQPPEVKLADEMPPPGDIEKPATAHNIGIGETDGMRSAKLKPLSEGTVLNGRYEIVRKIGGGGMGAVYLASDNNLGGVLRAVKEMVQAHIEEEQQEKAINDFKRESMILSSLDHVSIPTIYDYFYDDKESRFYLVMKYISGGDLSSRLRSAQEGKIDEKSVTEWAIQIIDVLDYLHNQPSTIVYRDLKPSNIMVDGNSGRAMLIDFGIARSISQKEEKGVTAVGTMGYAPPELFSGNVEPRSDIYSLGSTMFHLLTGADPQSNPLLIFDFQKNPRPRQINPQLSDQIERILMKSVEYSADSRFKSAAEMREILEEHLVKLKNGIVTYGVTEIPASVSLANQSVFCGFCGQRIVATDLFCAFCGAKQPIAQQGVHSEIYSQGALTAKLVIEGTSELNAPAFALQKDDNLLGRRDPMSNIFPEVDLSKYDPQTKISRRHARVWREGMNFMVEDLGSSNGTILARSANDSFRLVPNQPHVLAAGDKIRVGDATLHFVIG
ncbi:MAG: FHA domain-containing serine/threonine-protein kinase, partial [Pyrinomonadaceae bacterium]